MIEAVLKILALSFSEYILKAWNVFDLIIIILSLLQEILTLIGSLSVLPLSFARVLRVIRVLQLLRVIKFVQSIGLMLKTLLFSLPALMNILAIFILVLFIFSVRPAASDPSAHKHMHLSDATHCCVATATCMRTHIGLRFFALASTSHSS